MPNYENVSALYAVACALFAMENGCVATSVTVSDEDKAAGLECKLSELTETVKLYNGESIRDFCADKSATDFIKSHMSCAKVVFRVDEVSFLRTKVQLLSMTDYFRATMTEEVFHDFCADLHALKDKVVARAMNYVFNDKVNSGCVSDAKKLVAEFAGKYGIDLQGKEVSSWIARRLLQSVVCHAGKHVENVKPCNDNTFAALISIFLHCLLNNVKPRVNADKEDDIAALIDSIISVK